MFTIQISMFRCLLLSFIIHSSTFIYNSVCTVHSMFSILLSSVHCSNSALTVQMFKSNVQIQCSNPEFKFSVQSSVFIIQSSVFNKDAGVLQDKCMSDVHVSIGLQCHFRCILHPSSLVHEVTPDDDQVPYTNCSFQLLRYSC